MTLVCDAIAEIAASVLRLQRQIDHDEDLIDLGLDSLTVVEFVLQVEDAFAVEFDLEKVALTRFRTIRETGRLVCSSIDSS